MECCDTGIHPERRRGGAEAGGKLDHYVLIARKNLPSIFVETLKSFPDTFSQLSGFAFVLGA